METMTSKLPKINEPAPDFEAKSTHGIIHLSDYTTKQGKWVMLFSHPADFTPVCTTEFVAFSQNYDKFKTLNVQLIGDSIDSVYSHIAWARDIEKTFGVKVPFPIIADLDQKVARSYGMVHEAVADTAAVRAVFFIDPNSIIRAILYYPMTLGRSVDELLRVAEALQTADANACATPANWKPGEAVVVPPPLTAEDAEKRTEAKEYDVKQWYLSTRKLERPMKKTA